MEIIASPWRADPDEYRFVRISVNPVGRTSCTVTFLGSEDGVNWEPFAHHQLSINPKRHRRGGDCDARRSGDGPVDLA